MSIEGLGPVIPPMSGQPVERAAAPPQPEAVSGDAQAIAPPKGVDADLWGLLTPDEQSFFAQQTLLGPLTYGPESNADTTGTPPRGQRIDVRA